jgi:hypothetical protein
VPRSRTRIRSKLRKVAGEPFESRLTLFGVYENVIEYPPAFQFDNHVQLVYGADHWTICKPRLPDDSTYLQLISEIGP